MFINFITSTMTLCEWFYKGVILVRTIEIDRTAKTGKVALFCNFRFFFTDFRLLRDLKNWYFVVLAFSNAQFWKNFSVLKKKSSVLEKIFSVIDKISEKLQKLSKISSFALNFHTFSLKSGIFQTISSKNCGFEILKNHCRF